MTAAAQTQQVAGEEALRVEYLPLDEVITWDRNPKDHALDQIGKSIGRFGFVQPLILDERAQRLVAGHGRLAALSQMRAAGERPPKRVRVDLTGRWLVPVIRGISFNSDAEAGAYAVADNRLVEIGGWQHDKLSELLQEFMEEDQSLLEATGYDSADLDDLLKDLEGGVPATKLDPEPKLDKAADLAKSWGTASGQVWEVPSLSVPGRSHRLHCGDSTDPAAVARLLGDPSLAVWKQDHPALLVTSPPYGIGKEYEDAGVGEWYVLIAGMVKAYKPYIPLWAINLGDIKVGPDHREVHTYGILVDILQKEGIKLIGTRIWQKPPCWATGPYWLSSYRSVDEFEYLGLFGTTPHLDRTPEDWRYRGVWDFGSVTRNDDHPAMFPVELPRRLITLLTDEHAIVVDCFIGSGTTLIAAEQNARICYGMERDPKYLAVTLQRAKDAGLDPVKVKD